MLNTGVSMVVPTRRTPLARILSSRSGVWPCAVAGVAPLVALEWLQPHLFPVDAGSGLTQAPAWTMQTADLGGPLLLTALVAAANVVGFETWSWWRGARRPPTAVWAAALGVLAAALAWSRYQEAAIATAIPRSTTDQRRWSARARSGRNSWPS